MKQISPLNRFKAFRASMQAKRILREEKAKQFRREAAIMKPDDYREEGLEFINER